MKKRYLTYSLLLIYQLGHSGAWDSSPYNWENSEHNWENSGFNYDNSPMNWDNNPMNLNSDRIIRDTDGNPTGYIVPKDNGGSNIFNLEGDRDGYIVD
jgi:hypothetical protein